MTNKYKKKCEMCKKSTSTMSRINTSSGFREMWLCDKKNSECAYAEPINKKYS